MIEISFYYLLLLPACLSIRAYLLRGFGVLSMSFLKKLFFLGFLGVAGISFAAQAFLVKNIYIVGLQRVDQQTVLHYLPVKVGQRVDLLNTCNIIQALYKTGFFSDITLSQEGNTLIVHVVERPTVGSLEVVGNKDIPEEKMNSFLKSVGLERGAILDNSVVDRVQKSLQSEYYNRGRYNAHVSVETIPQSRNRVAIKIVISEGRTALIRDIEIIGNHAFSKSKLVRQIPINTTHFWSFFTHGDQYSKQKLADSVEALQNFYLSQGYVRFCVDSAQVEITPDKKDVTIVIRITEGCRYNLKGYALSGDLIVPECKLRTSIKLKPGCIYSKTDVDRAVSAIKFDLGDLGYAFPTVNVIPCIDDIRHCVFLNFYISPGNRFYVRHIHFTGNFKTADSVLRSQMRQLEGALASSRNIEESKRYLNLLGYLQDIQVEATPVPGTENLMDLEYRVTETPSAQAAASVGYGTNGLIFNANFNQTNFLGTGRAVGVRFNTTAFATGVSVNYNNPFYTIDGIQRGFSLYGQRTTPGEVNITNYSTDVYGLAVNYSLPVSCHNDSIQFGYGYQFTKLNIGSLASLELLNFVAQNGRNFDQLLLNFGWTRDSRDRALFPTRGLIQTANVQLDTPAGGSPLEYYKVNYLGSWYYPILNDDRDFVFNMRGTVGYGNGYASTNDLPFFANYFAGGIGFNGAVRGYETNTLGPRDSNNKPLGGNFLVVGSTSITFPNFMTEDLRTSLFVDVGNVYNTDVQFPSERAGCLRASAGIAAEWNLPMVGVLNVSFAQPINNRPGDELQRVQFTVGKSF